MMFYRGWGLAPVTRDALLFRFRPRLPAVRCDHVTFGLCEITDPPPPPAHIEVYGVLSLGPYHVLACRVDGFILQPREDRMYHITVARMNDVPSSHAGLFLKEHQHRIEQFKPFPIQSVPFIRKVAT